MAVLGETDPGMAVNRWVCPLTTFLGLCAIRPDGGFMGAGDYTQVLAKWEYALRNMHFFEAMFSEDPEEGGLFAYVGDSVEE